MWRPSLRLQPDSLFLVLAAAVGAIGALADAGFRAAIGTVHSLFVVRTGDMFLPAGPGIQPFLVVLFPTLGGVAVAALAYFSKREVGGYGMPSFLENVNLRGGKVSIRGTLLRTLAAALTLGSGGSAGVEGPVAVLGGSVGAAVARASRIVGDRVKLLVACGSSAAIAAAYGAPITGVFFAQEIVLAGNYDLRNFVRVVIASATSTVVARAMRGDEPLFHVAPFSLRSGFELPLYLALGLACGLFAPLLSRVFYWTRDLFRDSTLPNYVKPALGGLMVGLIALVYPRVLGDGLEVMQHLLDLTTYPGATTVLLLLGLALAKVVATSITIGSGGAGGVFGPSLFIGAVLGAGVGSFGVRYLPGYTGLPAHYAIVGMGALLAASTRAPLTAIFLVFEMTGSSSTAVLPTLIAMAAALYVANRIESSSIDEVDLVRRGIYLSGGREALTMSAVTVGQAMSTKVERIRADLPAPAMLLLLHESKANAFVVQDDNGQMVGLLSLQDLRTLDKRMVSEVAGLAIAGDLCAHEIVSAFPDESLAIALSRLDRYGYRQLPVVDRKEPRKVIGMLERRHVLSAYQRALPDHPRDSEPVPPAAIGTETEPGSGTGKA